MADGDASNNDDIAAAEIPVLATVRVSPASFRR